MKNQNPREYGIVSARTFTSRLFASGSECKSNRFILK